MYPQPLRVAVASIISLCCCSTAVYPQQVSEKIAADIPLSIYTLDLLEVTGMTGKPHRPSSTDGHSPVFVFVSSPSTLTGYRRRMPVARARPIGYAYRLGRCGD